jgi:SAM-dependent methyltransferase
MSGEDLSLELASFIGSTSLEDHYWNSGWQTANVQLVAGLEVSESIIDIGCGVGRLAYGLYNWFGGRYVGVDIVPSLVDYCTRRFPRFEFHLLDVRSPFYNPNGTESPDTMTLPSGKNQFDVAVLFSVYTHLLPDSLVRMTAEVSRILKPGGRCLATFFVLDEMTDQASFSFAHEQGPFCRVEEAETPEHAVGYRKRYLIETFGRANLEPVSFYRGSWTGRGGLGLQDEMLFHKRT